MTALLLMLTCGRRQRRGHQATLLELGGLTTSPWWPPWLGGLGPTHPSHVLATRNRLAAPGPAEQLRA